MFITKKALREKIEEAIAKEHERQAINERIERCGQEFMQEVKWMRGDFNRMWAEMNARVRKLEGNPPNEELGVKARCEEEPVNLMGV